MSGLYGVFEYPQKNIRGFLSRLLADSSGKRTPIALFGRAGAQKLANLKPPHKISHGVICLLRFNQFL